MMTQMPHVAALERSAVQALGVRALWLHLHLTGVEALALAPRDRELICIVATRPWGVPITALASRLSATAALNREAARHWIQRLVDQGWLSLREEPADTYVDLAERDLTWITDQLNRIDTH